ncbi:MAG: 5-formyltetrahydrofolate cyclo-ligase [Planctomycetota bacterium]
MSETKKNLRQTVLTKLAALSMVARRGDSRRVVERLTSCVEWQRATTVLAFYSFGAEVDTHEFLAECLRQGKTLALPRLRSRNIISVHHVTNLDVDLERNRLGFREPNCHLAEISLSQIDLVIVPGLAYDLKGNRLGRGRGCYDHLLASRELQAVCCAIVFDCQVVAAVPTTAHDRPVDMVVTESRVLRWDRHTPMRHVLMNDV